MEKLKKEELYPLQETVLSLLQSMHDEQFDQAKLCGGTALARCWLDHRVSYDLDFFLPYGFQAAKLSHSLKNSGINFQMIELVDDARKVNRLHSYIEHDGLDLKVSFIEDAYFDLYPAIKSNLGKVAISTEEIPGLYHRKLRTISGNSEVEGELSGGRQTARDLFDLYVLSKAHMPIEQFMERLPYAFPKDDFYSGLIQMDWMKVSAELPDIICNEKWAAGKDLKTLQAHLWEEIGATPVLEDAEVEYEDSPKAKLNTTLEQPVEPEPEKLAKPKKKWGWWK
ncbi:nucleotidyl transferase AbiEii/AbiGii toxin family protein [Paraburkholderia tropica]|uniref:nucleotidyl transferase AbiEii/AbiGii toxin family protein n=1 Tax=Paraburkholderia tropica TaxID=92647 RepID=UPI003D2DFEA1